jgi:SAM-dependent methyltransferase
VGDDDWTCILCGRVHGGRPEEVDREGALCEGCGSSWRNRACTLLLMLGLGYEPQSFSDLPQDWSRRGVGFDDAPAIFSILPTRLSYINTHLGRFPDLDLIEPPAQARAAFEFALCSDVLEHVVPPVERGFKGLASILRPGGFAVLTVPVAPASATVEHYPGLTAFEELDGPTVRWCDADGQWHTDLSPEMHGGTGLVLAFRQFGLQDLIASLGRAGFGEVIECPPRPDLGVFPLAGAGVLLARLPGG